MQKQQEVYDNILKIYQLEIIMMKLLLLTRTILLIHLIFKVKITGQTEDDGTKGVEIYGSTKIFK